jgi:hypothetical protein
MLVDAVPRHTLPARRSERIVPLCFCPAAPMRPSDAEQPWQEVGAKLGATGQPRW